MFCSFFTSHCHSSIFGNMGSWLFGYFTTYHILLAICLTKVLCPWLIILVRIRTEKCDGGSKLFQFENNQLNCVFGFLKFSRKITVSQDLHLNTILSRSSRQFSQCDECDIQKEKCHLKKYQTKNCLCH